MKNFLCCIVLAAASCCAQVINIGPTGPVVSLIQLTASSTTIVAGGTSTLSAQLIMSDGTQNIFVTSQCTWTSATPAVATISSVGIVTGVAVGSSVMTCADNGFSGTLTITVGNSPRITNPACGSPPCTLGQVTNNVAYSFSFAATGGQTPYTWDCNGSCSGVFPAGLALSTAGVLSGTTLVNGTTNFTIRVTDNAAATATLAVSFTVSGAACGPPLYACASYSTANLPAGTTLAPLFLSTAPTATTCAGDCQNAVREDTVIPGHVAGTEKQTRITDAATMCNVGASVGDFTGGGDNDRPISMNGTFVGIVTGGQACVYHLAIIGGVIQVVNAGVSPSIKVPYPFEFSWVKDNRFYYVTSSHILNQGDIPQGTVNTGGTGGVNVTWVSGTQFACGTGWTTSLAIANVEYPIASCNSPTSITLSSGPGALSGANYTNDFTFVVTQLFDYMATGACPGNPNTLFTAAWTGALGIKDDDSRFGISIGPTNQGHSDWMFSWDRTLGCSTARFDTGQSYAFCTVNCSTAASLPTMSTAATSCWGSQGSIGKGTHGSQCSGDGLFCGISLTTPWTQGGCAGLTAASVGEVFWTPGTNLNTWCRDPTPGSLSCSGHNSVGVSRLLSPNWRGPNTRPLNNLTNFTTFMTSLNIQDEHCSWPHNNNGTPDDTLPWICASDLVTAANGGVYSPAAYNNEVMAWFPGGTPPGSVARFFYTRSCGQASGAHCTSGGDTSFGAQESIGVASPKGDYFCYVSTQLGGEGLDNTNHLRADGYCGLTQ